MIFIQLGEVVCYQQGFPRVPQPALLHTRAPAVLCGTTKQSHVHVLWDASSPSSAPGRVQKGTLLGGPYGMNVDSPLVLCWLGTGSPPRDSWQCRWRPCRAVIRGGAFSAGAFGGLRSVLPHRLAVSLKRTDCQMGEKAVPELVARHLLPPASFPGVMPALARALEVLRPRATPLVAGGTPGGSFLLLLVLCLLPRLWEPELLQAELVEALEALHHDGSVGLHPAAQGIIMQSALSPAICPHRS